MIGELTKIMGMTGGKSITAVVGSSTSLLGAVDYAGHWFENRVRLFLDDDIWPVLNCETGFYSDSCVRVLTDVWQSALTVERLHNAPDRREVRDSRSSRSCVGENFNGTCR